MEKLTLQELEKVALYFVHETNPQKLKTYSAFIRLYEDVTSPDYTVPIEPTHLISHERIRKAVDILKANPEQTRKEFIRHAFPDYITPTTKREDPATVIVQVAYMLDCNSKDRHSINRNIGDWHPTRWEEDQSFHDFVRNTLPISTGQVIPHQEDLRMLAAWKLKHRYKLRLIGTNNLAEHLLYDTANGGSLRIFHHVSWLAAQLRHHEDDMNTTNPEQSLERGLLSRQLVAETLDTFYRVLFPLSRDKRRNSTKLLKMLIRKGRFDLNATSISFLPLDGLKYHFWGDRLRVLAELANNPPPTSWIAKWMERKKSERNVLWIAIIGIFLSAFFGMLSCVIGALQLWAALR